MVLTCSGANLVKPECLLERITRGLFVETNYGTYQQEAIKAKGTSSSTHSLAPRRRVGSSLLQETAGKPNKDFLAKPRGAHKRFRNDQTSQELMTLESSCKTS
jgi:hypothetical protein